MLAKFRRWTNHYRELNKLWAFFQSTNNGWTHYVYGSTIYSELNG